MKIYIILLVLVRTFTQFVVNSYEEESSLCRHILEKALEEDIPSVKSAYFVKVMEEDQRAFFDTLNKYHIGFLASNTTYASEIEIEGQACTMPDYIIDGLEWTAGVTPLVIVWVGYSMIMWLKEKCKKTPEYKTPKQQIKKTLDKPPRAPRKPPRTQHMDYIRPSKPVKKEAEESIAGKLIKNISPSLRQRMMPPDV